MATYIIFEILIWGWQKAYYQGGNIEKPEERFCILQPTRDRARKATGGRF